jgi:hypothetical protein
MMLGLIGIEVLDASEVLQHKLQAEVSRAPQGSR